MDLHQRIVALSTLDCAVARRFQDRPVLHAVAGRLLVEQWQQRQLGHGHDPLALYLISRPVRGANAWIRPLSMVLIERFCRRATLNLTEGEDFISSHPLDDPAHALDIDLHPVELLINECGPFVVERHREELVQYWSTFDSSGQTPWQWYARYLEQQLGHAIDSRKDDGRLTSSGIDLANQLRNVPGEAGQHNSSTITHLQTDLSDNGKIDLDLGSALLLEHGGDTPVTLLYTLVGKLLAFPRGGRCSISSLACGPRARYRARTRFSSRPPPTSPSKSRRWACCTSSCKYCTAARNSTSAKAMPWRSATTWIA